jgi:hypothetical protein
MPSIKEEILDQAVIAATEELIQNPALVLDLPLHHHHRRPTRPGIGKAQKSPPPRPATPRSFGGC